MCNVSCVIFGALQIGREDVAGRRVLEIGACDVNGSLRPLCERYEPASYLGIDTAEGPGVDMVCSVEEIVARFGRSSFDLVVCTEVLEHVRDWRLAVSNIKNILAPGGVLILTTRSEGVPYHGYPSDFWRFSLDDMRRIFSDFSIEALEADREAPGVFIRARRPEDFSEADLAGYPLFSVIGGGHETEITEDEFLRFLRYYERRERLTALMRRASSVPKTALLRAYDLFSRIGRGARGQTG